MIFNIRFVKKNYIFFSYYTKLVLNVNITILFFKVMYKVKFVIIYHLT